MTEKERNLRLKKLCRIIALCSASVPMPEWPPFVIEADSYLQKYYFRHLYNLITRARNQNISLQRIGLSLNPSRVSQIMHSIYGLSSSGLTDEEKRDLVDSLVGIIGTRREDPFCEDKRNILLSQSEIEDLISESGVFNKVEDINWVGKSQLLSKINTLLFSLCDLINVCQHATNHEFHGTYNLENQNSKIIVRDYYDLKVTEIWPILKKLPIEKITTIEVYQDIDIHFSFFNHIIPSSSLPNHLICMTVLKVNNQNEFFSIDELNDIYCDLVLVMKEFSNEVKLFEKSDWIRKYIEMHYYALKPFSDLVGEEWNPSKEQIEIIDTEPDMKAASAFRILNGLSFDERVIALEQLYNGFLF